MVISQNRGTLIQTPKYHDPDYGDPQRGTQIVGSFRCFSALGISSILAIPNYRNPAEKWRDPSIPILLVLSRDLGHMIPT